MAYNTRGVKITNLYVPLGASHEAPLDCRYNLEGDQLYDVKWYKDGQQFFRCQPNGEMHVYAVDGVKVLKTGYPTVGSCPLTLINLSFKSGGEYRCEVTTEGPHFKFAAESAKLRVIQSSRRQSDDPSTPKTDIDEYSDNTSHKTEISTGN